MWQYFILFSVTKKYAIVCVRSAFYSFVYYVVAFWVVSILWMLYLGILLRAFVSKLSHRQGLSFLGDICPAGASPGHANCRRFSKAAAACSVWGLWSLPVRSSTCYRVPLWLYTSLWVWSGEDGTFMGGEWGFGAGVLGIKVQVGSKERMMSHGVSGETWRRAGPG